VTSPPRITLVHSPAGNGHRSAARSIAAAIGRARPDADVEVLNVLDFAPRWFRYDLAWGAIQRHGGRFWDWLFDTTNRPAPAAVGRWREALNLRLLARLSAHLAARDPDRIVCTHYLPAVAVARLRRAGQLDGCCSVVVTDYLSHQAWINPAIDRYHVATADVGRSLVAGGVPATSIDVTGIPIGDDPTGEAQPRPRLVTGRLQVLFLAAGVPRRMVREALRSLRGVADLEIDLVAGGDPTLLRRLADWAAELGMAVRLHGFVPGLRALMQRAHLVVTKAGGLVVSECLARGRGMVFPWPAPGHERGNRAHALAAGAAVAIDDPRRLGATLAAFARQPGRVVEMGMAAARAATPGAADRIARDLLRGLPEAARRGAARGEP
jgi:processive 1,2-diacylglycerol beta-glucosyltransferase